MVETTVCHNDFAGSFSAVATEASICQANANYQRFVPLYKQRQLSITMTMTMVRSSSTTGRHRNEEDEAAVDVRSVVFVVEGLTLPYLRPLLAWMVLPPHSLYPSQ